MRLLTLAWFTMTAFPVLAADRTNLNELAKAPAGKKIAYGEDPLQFGELHLPEGDGPHRVVINIHGGCWLAQYDIKHSRALANAVAAEGYAVWNLEYRRVGNDGGGWPGTFLDIARGADHLRAIASTYNLNVDKVLAMGHSAGGHLALWLSTRSKIPTDSELYTPNPINITGVVALAPASELDKLHERGACGNVVDKMLGGSPEAFPERYKLATPTNLLPVKVGQTILVGDKDKDWGWIGPIYMQRAREAGQHGLTYVRVPDAGHFEVIDPSTPSWIPIRGSLKELSRR